MRLRSKSNTVTRSTRTLKTHLERQSLAWASWSARYSTSLRTLQAPTQAVPKARDIRHLRSLPHSSQGLYQPSMSMARSIATGRLNQNPVLHEWRMACLKFPSQSQPLRPAGDQLCHRRGSNHASQRPGAPCNRPPLHLLRRMKLQLPMVCSTGQPEMHRQYRFLQRVGLGNMAMHSTALRSSINH